jgi:hypothetical protein
LINELTVFLNSALRFKVGTMQDMLIVPIASQAEAYFVVREASAPAAASSRMQWMGSAFGLLFACSAYRNAGIGIQAGAFSAPIAREGLNSDKAARRLHNLGRGLEHQASGVAAHSGPTLPANSCIDVESNLSTYRAQPAA